MVNEHTKPGSSKHWWLRLFKKLITTEMLTYPLENKT